MVQGLSPAVQKDFRDDLLVANAPGFLTSDADIAPVRAIGSGIPRNNSRQAVKTYTVFKTTALTTTYTQVATATASSRIFFLGISFGAVDTSDSIYIEDAAGGNIEPSDNSTSGLFYADSVSGISGYPAVGFARECKSGIRVRVVNTAGQDMISTIYYLEERTDGQQVAL